MMSAESRMSVQEQFTVSDFIEWHQQKRLILNPGFQRRPVWKSDARSYLIDTILLGYPMPKVYIRTQIDLKTRLAIRDVVDGQQRLRAILDYADDKFALNRRSERYSGKKFSQLDEDVQQRFLSYPVGVDHLVNATDTVVLQVFARLNSYTVPLNAAEKRHALYETELRWFVHELSNDYRWFLQKHDIVSTKRMLRMEDDIFFAELVNVLMTGIGDAGAAALDSLYKNNKGELPNAGEMANVISDWVTWMDRDLAVLLESTTLSRTYQLHMLFAAYAHQVAGIPPGRLEALPPRTGIAPTEQVVDRLAALVQAVETDDEDDRDEQYEEFVEASSGATTRFNTRKVRFLAYSDAISAR
jgi:hypothetical protein